MNYVCAIAVFLCGEIISIVIFIIMKKSLASSIEGSQFLTTTIKGIIERLVLFTGLLHNFPQILIAFGALKLGTRLHDENENDISNTYFLFGNLTSILFAMIYTIITKTLWDS